MADEPISELGGKTPLQAAHTPSMDWIARNGRCGLLKSVPEGYAPGSEVANLAILGYDLDKVFEGRGSLEAASMGIRHHASIRRFVWCKTKFRTILWRYFSVDPCGCCP